MLEDEHRSSMGEESLHHLWQILWKYYGPAWLAPQPASPRAPSPRNSIFRSGQNGRRGLVAREAVAWRTIAGEPNIPYVAKVLRTKRKKWKMKKIIYDEKKRKKGRRNKKEKKWEGNKIKLRKIIKTLLGSFCFISYQVSWWQIHTQIFQPRAIR
jgi:hypothetical protein